MTHKPAIINRYWYSIDWDVEALWALDLPVRSHPVVDLLWHLDVPIWPDEVGNPYTTSPRKVIKKPKRYVTEFARIQVADLTHPIEVFRHLGRLMILDGIHRLAKAYMAGADRIDVRDIPESAVRKL